MIVVTDKLSTESFHAFIDEQLSDEQYLQVEAQLDEIPEKVEEIQQCQIINERLREVFDPIVEEEIPDDLYELALYGITSEYQDEAEDYQQYGYEFDEATNTVSGFNDEIVSPMDSFDTALELQDENFIDDDEFAELEQLSVAGEQGLADFDIDNIRDDAGNILPDIFGEAEKSNLYAATSQPAKTNDELSMLDEIGALSLEPLEAQDEAQSEQETLQEAYDSRVSSEIAESEYYSENEDNYLDEAVDETAAELELEPLEQAQESFSFETTDIPELNPEQNNDMAALLANEEEDAAQKQKRILDTLEASEELSLESLDAELSAGAISPQPGETGEETLEETIEAEARSVDSADSENDAEEIQIAAEITDDSEQLAVEADNLHDENATETDAAGSMEEEPSPDAKVELTQTTTANQTAARNKIIKPGAAVSDMAEYPMDEIVEQLDEITDDSDQAPPDVVAEFFAGNKTEPDFEVSEVVKHFEEVADEFDQHYEQDPFDSPVANIKQKADDVLHSLNTRFSALKSSFTRKDDSVPDFNRAPPPFHAAASRREIPEQASIQPPITPVGEESVDTTNIEFEFDDEPNSEGISRKIGDTLKYYKEKISQGKSAETEEVAPAGNHMVPHVEISGLEKYRRLISHNLEQVSPENRMTIGGAILLVIGLIVGGAAATIMSEQPVNVITPEKVEQLAVDAHVLYTQQNQDFAGNPSTSITESMQWLSARIGRQIRLADVQLEDFQQVRAIVMPTMVGYATANIFENKNHQSVTLLISAAAGPVANSPLVCRVPAGIDGMCSWVKDSVSYVAVANLSSSRVRAFSQSLADSL